MPNSGHFAFFSLAIFFIVIVSGFGYAYSGMFAQAHISFTNLRITDVHGVPLSKIYAGQEVLIQADITNNGDSQQSFTYEVVMLDKNDMISSDQWVSGDLSPHSTVTASLSHRFNLPGTYQTNAHLHNAEYVKTESQKLSTITHVESAVTLTAFPPSETITKEAYFEFKTDLDGYTFQCRLDNSQFSECVSPTYYEDLDFDLHTFQIQAISLDKSESYLAIQHTWNIIEPTDKIGGFGGKLDYGGSDPCIELNVYEPYFTRNVDSLVEAVYEIIVYSCSNLNQIVTFAVKGLDGIDYSFYVDNLETGAYSYYQTNYLTVVIPDTYEKHHPFEITSKVAIKDNEAIYYLVSSKQNLSLESPAIAVILGGSTFMGEISTFQADTYFIPQDMTITSYHWDFGDGKQADGQTVEHMYKEDGVYDVVLTTTDNNGGTFEFYSSIYISDPSAVSEEIAYESLMMTSLYYDDHATIVRQYVISIIISGFALWYFLRKPTIDDKEYPKFYWERTFERIF